MLQEYGGYYEVLRGHVVNLRYCKQRRFMWSGRGKLWDIELQEIKVQWFCSSGSNLSSELDNIPLWLNVSGGIGL